MTKIEVLVNGDLSSSAIGAIHEAIRKIAEYEDRKINGFTVERRRECEKDK